MISVCLSNFVITCYKRLSKENVNCYTVHNVLFGLLFGYTSTMGVIQSRLDSSKSDNSSFGFICPTIITLLLISVLISWLWGLFLQVRITRSANIFALRVIRTCKISSHNFKLSSFDCISSFLHHTLTSYHSLKSSLKDDSNDWLVVTR